MFHIVALPDSGVDGQGHYNMVSEPMVSMLSLDGSDKWSLDPRFWVEMVFEGTNFEPYNVSECRGVTWSCYEAQEE